MARASRLAKLERDLAFLEARFEEQLLIALRTCAAGTWGLFDSEDWGFSYGLRPEAEKLVAMCVEIRGLSGQLGYTVPNALCERFLVLREPRRANDPGDPKLAATFLAEIEAGQFALAGR